MLKSILGVLILTIGLASCRPEDGRIVNGTNAAEGVYGFMLALTYKRFRYEHPFCGASLLSPCWAATAAHCVEGEKPEDLVIRYMATQLNSTDKHFVGVDKTFIHKNFNASNFFANDIAMVKFEHALFFHSGLSPVALDQDNIKFPAKEGEFLPAIQLGWGLNKAGGAPQNHLQERALKIYSHLDCLRLMHGHVTQCQICSGVDNGGAGACQGDSGGPLVVHDGSKYVVMGMTSFGFGNCNEYPNNATASTNITCHLPWISNIMSTEGSCY